MSASQPTRVLVVCLGNICRSPTAEAALREAVDEAGLGGRVEVDSAGTGTWHLGEPPDHRMVEAAAAHGLRLDGKARRITVEDFGRYDWILVMDRHNLADVRALAPDDEARARVRLYREFEEGADGEDVPDPYYGGTEGFARVVEIARAASRGVVRELLS